MADTKISALTSVASVDSADEFAVNDAGVSKKASAGQILTFVNANITLGAALDVNSQEISSSAGTDILLHSDNDINLILGDAAGVDDLNIKDSTNAIVASINSDGALSATSYGGILEANLLDKSAAETITGEFTFSNGSVGPRVQDFTAGGTIAAGEIVYMAASGKVGLADANDTAITARVLGVAQEAAVLDGTVSVLIGGVDANQSALTIGSLYYLSTTAGAVTATAPAASGDTVVRVGTAVSATELLLDIETIVVRA